MRALISKGKLPQLTPPVCKPVNAYASGLDNSGFDEADADAWHSQHDVA